MTKWVNADTGDKIDDKEAAVKQGIDVISKDAYRKRNDLVNAATGKPIKDRKAAEEKGIEVITSQAYRDREGLGKWVNADTGKCIKDKEAAEKEGIRVITKVAYRQSRKWVDANTGLPIGNKKEAEKRGITVIAGTEYRKKLKELKTQYVDSENGDPIYDKEAAEKEGIKVILSETYKKRTWVDSVTGKKIKDKGVAKKQKIKIVTKDAFDRRGKLETKWVDAVTGNVVEDKKIAEQQGISMISYSAFRQKQDLVDAMTGDPVANKALALAEGKVPITKEAFRKRKDWVDVDTGKSVSNKDKAAAEREGRKLVHYKFFNDERYRQKLQEAQDQKLNDNYSENSTSSQESDNYSSQTQHSRKRKANSSGLFVSKNRKKQSSNEITIKQEPVDINIETIMEKLRIMIIEERCKNNATQNCGYWTKQSIMVLTHLLQGKEPPTMDVSIKNSGKDGSTQCEVIFDKVPIKTEGGNIARSHGKPMSELRTVGSIALASKEGLHAELPPQASLKMVDLTAEPPTTVSEVNLHPDKAEKTKVKVSKINSELMRIAQEQRCIIVGHVSFTGIGGDTGGHVIAFCATADKVFYIDGSPPLPEQKNSNDPIFSDLETEYSFVTQFRDRLPGVYADDCFYLEVFRMHDNKCVPRMDMFKLGYVSDQ